MSKWELHARPYVPDTLTCHPVSAGREYPVALAVRSEHGALQLLGWRTATGMRLHSPALLSMQFTTALAQYVRSVLLAHL